MNPSTYTLPILLYCILTTCTAKWINFKGNFYYVSTEEKSQLQAHEECEANHASLVSILDADENQHLKKYVSETNLEHWVGLHRIDDVWTWNDGAPLDYQNWAKDPDPDPRTVNVNHYSDSNADSGNVYDYYSSSVETVDNSCGYMQQAGKWFNGNCAKTRPFICKWSCETVQLHGLPESHAQIAGEYGLVPKLYCNKRRVYKLFGANYYMSYSDTEKRWSVTPTECSYDARTILAYRREDQSFTPYDDSPQHWLLFSNMKPTVSTNVTSRCVECHKIEITESLNKNNGVYSLISRDKPCDCCTRLRKQAYVQGSKYLFPYQQKIGLGTTSGWVISSDLCGEVDKAEVVAIGDIELPYAHITVVQEMVDGAPQDSLHADRYFTCLRREDPTVLASVMTLRNIIIVACVVGIVLLIIMCCCCCYCCRKRREHREREAEEKTMEKGTYKSYDKVPMQDTSARSNGNNFYAVNESPEPPFNPDLQPTEID